MIISHDSWQKSRRNTGGMITVTVITIIMTNILVKKKLGTIPGAAASVVTVKKITRMQIKSYVYYKNWVNKVSKCLYVYRKVVNVGNLYQIRP